MKRIFAVIAMGVVVSASASAALVQVPSCEGLTLDLLVSGGDYYDTGCFVQDKIFSNFQFGAGQIDPSQVNVYGDTDPRYPGAPIVNIGIGISGPFGVGPDQEFDINWRFMVTVTDPNYLIDDASLSLTGVDFPQGGTGHISGSEDWCAGDFLLISGCANGQLVHQGISLSGTSGTAYYHVSFESGVTFVDVFKDIQVHGGDAGVDVSRIDQIFSQTTGIPEPASMILLGSGLSLIGFVGRKLRKA